MSVYRINAKQWQLRMAALESAHLAGDSQMACHACDRTWPVTGAWPEGLSVVTHSSGAYCFECDSHATEAA